MTPQSIIGYEFVHKVGDHGYRAKVTDFFEEQKKFIISLGDGNKEELISYNEMVDAVNRQMGEDDAAENDPHDVLWELEHIDSNTLNRAFQSRNAL